VGKPFNVGISGAGVIGRVHAEALGTIDTARLVAVAEPRTDAGKAFVDQFGGTLYESFVEMLLHDDLDVVIITTPSGIHPDQVVLAAEAGKHVITEKPMAITREGLDRMIGATEEAEVHLAVIFQNRLSADVLRVKRAIEQGVFGTPVLANGTMYWHRTQEYYEASGGWRGTWALDGGGALMNQAIHTVDLLQWMMGGVREVRAHTATLTHAIETEDTAAVSFLFRNGALGSLTATTSAARDWPVRVEIVGTTGRVTLENNVVTLWEAETGKEDISLIGDDQALVDGWAPDEHFGAGHARQLRLIFEAMAADRDPYVPGREARQAVDSILAIYEAARAGTTVSVE
jgi:UDP-N-acetyl-2-amino-2-deoxyglucuronate dehydrogenase